ncbi:hypothetical protein DY000_02054345 [Brassica cretica]|uniref:Ubiquitin-like protease family profile domain-containing protein n=1 Tax=Brassica cretica TaxID=69181 RepID=A0ABQ7A5M1_BRACR|nr:hypothetical protein DY000_02054345 [Brassica cretica]
MAQLFEQNFSAMEERLQKQMGERFEKMQSELKGSLKDASVEVDDIEPSTSKPSPIKPSPSKPSSSKPPPSIPSPRRSKRLDVNLSHSDDMDEDVGTQGLEGFSQSSYVLGFDPSQTNKDNKARDCPYCITSTKNHGIDSRNGPALNPTPLRIGHTTFNLTVAQRILTPGKWLRNEEMDAIMYMWRENTTLRRWNKKRVAFMSALFYLQLDNAYRKFHPNKKAYELPDLFLAYERGELPSHGRTDKVWGVDIDRLYFPLFVNGNHWIYVCVNIIEKKVEAFDCQRGRNRQYVEKFAAMIPRIVKAVAPPESKK